mmetsp:Transcript_4167/g.8201  ORF Transcript_4167/g.8201 Transcript_4167/m.8201 type:complete len:257 (-) Transcript_4167:1375-2145(-)
MAEAESGGTFVRDRSAPLYKPSSGRTSAEAFTTEKVQNPFQANFVSGKEVETDVKDNATAFKMAEKTKWVPLAQQLEQNRMKAEEEQRESLRLANTAVQKRLDEDEVNFYNEAEERKREEETKKREEEEKEVAMFEAARAFRRYEEEAMAKAGRKDEWEEDRGVPSKREREELAKAEAKAKTLSARKQLKGRIVLAGKAKATGEAEEKGAKRKVAHEEEGQSGDREVEKKQKREEAESTSLSAMLGGYSSSDDDEE